MVFIVNGGSASLFLPLTSNKGGRMRIFLVRRCLDTIMIRNRCFNLRNKHKNKKARKHDLQVKCKRLKDEMEVIRKDQKNIKEGQLQLAEKLKAIEMECELLQKETKLMIQRSALTQLRLALMFNILKAREEGNFAKAAKITQLLRIIIARDNIQQQTLWNK